MAWYALPQLTGSGFQSMGIDFLDQLRDFMLLGLSSCRIVSIGILPAHELVNRRAEGIKLTNFPPGAAVEFGLQMVGTQVTIAEQTVTKVANSRSIAPLRVTRPEWHVQTCL